MYSAEFGRDFDNHSEPNKHSHHLSDEPGKSLAIRAQPGDIHISPIRASAIHRQLLSLISLSTAPALLFGCLLRQQSGKVIRIVSGSFCVRTTNLNVT